MSKQDPHKEKYFNFYMALALTAAKQSEALRKKVGAVIVLPSGLIGLGWNGTASGLDNKCENSFWGNGSETLETKPEVIHAERNALDKLTKAGISSQGSILFVTTAPCFECAKSIEGVGITRVMYYDKYKCDSGINYLESLDITVQQFN